MEYRKHFEQAQILNDLDNKYTKVVIYDEVFLKNYISEIMKELLYLQKYGGDDYRIDFEFDDSKPKSYSNNIGIYNIFNFVSKGNKTFRVLEDLYHINAQQPYEQHKTGSFEIGNILKLKAEVLFNSIAFVSVVTSGNKYFIPISNVDELFEQKYLDKVIDCHDGFCINIIIIEPLQKDNLLFEVVKTNWVQFIDKLNEKITSLCQIDYGQDITTIKFTKLSFNF